MSWQPASTIPKDGTVIIVMCLHATTSPIFWGKQHDDETVEGWYCVDGGDLYTDEDFTDAIGWMAMPDFPDLFDFYEKVNALKKEKKD